MAWGDEERSLKGLTCNGLPDSWKNGANENHQRTKSSPAGQTATVRELLSTKGEKSSKTKL
jgi:hypothetical protein